MAGGITPENTKGWLNVLWPLAEKGGPIVTLMLLFILIISTWWLAGWMHDCVDRNRALTEKLLAQQAAFYQELRLSLAHCEPKH